MKSTWHNNPGNARQGAGAVFPAVNPIILPLFGGHCRKYLRLQDTVSALLDVQATICCNSIVSPGLCFLPKKGDRHSDVPRALRQLCIVASVRDSSIML